jgi:ketosteroid isomerase-like protein
MQRRISGNARRTMRLARIVAMMMTLVLAACARLPDETQIRQAIAAMQAAAEARDASGVLDRIADDFSGQRGEVDRAALSRIVKIEFLQREGVGVSIGSIEIALDGDRATATFAMTLTDRSQRWIPGGGETYDVVSGWRRDGRAWVCYNATWTAQR